MIDVRPYLRKAYVQALMPYIDSDGGGNIL